ncbi:hypothetical protein [Cryptosporangium aurantiacum]|uniref:Uncharacterized protein n=1 Tax=Cryptosporangium aurantiacum TaxID=134849 RepID=A0A1M7QMR0_9ACTN|nr:hypothetical protein [Cryptosporangium aurantiacum]SHN32700.1 hypothetical protein SAMN05443668_10568 [Cryptosporangium aurantiacum]
MMHGRFHPDDITAAARLRVVPATAAGPAVVTGVRTRPAVRTAPTFLDRIETRIWARPDSRMRAAGWEVVRLGRWRRQYRHPRYLAAARAQHAAEQCAPAEHVVTGRITTARVGTARTVRAPARWAA